MTATVKTPEVGMGVTLCVGSDRSPGTIVKVSPSGKTFEFTRDAYMRTDSNGLSEEQSYVFLPQEDGPRYTARYSQKFGRYRTRGGQTVGVGFRSAYWDPCF